MHDSFNVFIFVSSIYFTIVNWRLYSKAGKPGYAALIPFYSTYVRFKISFGDCYKMYIILILIGILLFMAGEYVSSALVTVASNILYAACSVKLARAFGKRGRFNVGVALLPHIFLAILAFGDSKYEGPQ